MAMLRDDWPAAEAYYRQVLELRPNQALALNNLAYLLVKLKKPGALPLAQRAVALAPRRPGHARYPGARLRRRDAV